MEFVIVFSDVGNISAGGIKERIYMQKFDKYAHFCAHEIMKYYILGNKCSF